MPSILFTATDRTQKQIISRVDADDLSEARQKLEAIGYSGIVFLESELSGETRKLFGAAGERAKNVKVKDQAAGYYDSRLRMFFFKLFKVIGLPLGISLFYAYRTPTWTNFAFVGFIVVLSIFRAVPTVLFSLMFTAHCWNQNRKVRILAGIAKAFNTITPNKIPKSEIDVYLASADARDGLVEKGLLRIAKYKNDPKVSPRLYKSMQSRIFGNAKRFDKVAEILESSINEGTAGTEEMIDYAVCLARRQHRTEEARRVIECVTVREQTPVSNLFIPYCQAVIEVEDENHSQADFILVGQPKSLRLSKIIPA